MTICFITIATQLGGAERVLLETIDVLKERGIECRVLIGGSGELAQELEAAGIPYALVDAGSWVAWSRPSTWCRAKAVLKIAARVLPAIQKIKEWRCDAIYSNSLTACSGALLARLLGLPHIWHLHEFGKEDHKLFYKFGEAFSNRAIGEMSSSCIVVSNALAGKYSKFIPPSKLTVVYPSMHRGISADDQATIQAALPPVRAGRIRLVVVGGLVEGKGQADAVRAVGHLVREGIDAEVMVVGEGYLPYMDTLQDMVRASGMEQRVHFIGHVPDASPFIGSADLVLVCSRSEAFGRVTIEAMFAGKPVIGAAAGATVELIRDGVNGLLYRCGDPADLAKKIRLLADRPALRVQLGENGRRWAGSRFTRDRYGKELMSVLSSVVATDRVPHQDLVNLATR